MIRSYSVIVPVLNKHDAVIRTLESIEESMRFFDANHPDATEISGEVVMVDEGSTDGTLEKIASFIKDRPRFRLVNHYRSLGPGPARNTAVRVSRGDILFFCDQDDLYFPHHIYLCYRILEGAPSQGEQAGESARFSVTL